MSLIELKPGGEVQSQVLNDNFDYLEYLMSSSIQQLEAKVIGASNNISNITSNMAVIQTNLSNTTTTANGKASKDLSDVEPSVKFKEIILDYIAPSFSSEYSISSGFTTPSAGWCYFGGQSDGTSSVTIDGAYLEVSWDIDDGQSRGELFVFVGKGTVVDSFNRIREARFFPCKGVQ